MKKIWIALLAVTLLAGCGKENAAPETTATQPVQTTTQSTKPENEDAYMNITAEEAKKLMEITKQCFYKGAAAAVIDNRIGDIGAAVEAHASENGFSVVRRYVGHGIGHDLHEEPEVPNYGTPGRGARLYSGMVLAIEPMINVGTFNVRELSDKWTVVTADGKLSAHYENTVAVTENGPLLLTDIETV